MLDSEILLTGGRMTPGVVRVGDTVRRPHKPCSETVLHRLRELRNRGFTCCPRFLGFDEQGREVHEFIEGYNPPDLGLTTTEQFLEIMEIARQLHDCSAGMAGAGKVLCHHDLSPCNVIFSADCRKPKSCPVAIIDWDSCGPGERWEELCYICWLWLDLGNPGLSVPTLLNAIRQGLQRYGASESDRKEFSEKLFWRMQRVADSVTAERPNGWQDTVEWVQNCQNWVRIHAKELDKAAREQ